MARPVRAFLPLLLLLLAAAALAAALWPWPEVEAAGEPQHGPGGFALPVTFAPVETGAVVQRVELVGDVMSRRRTQLAFERGGRVEEMAVDLGDAVEQGQLLARLDDSVLEEQVAVARARAAAFQAEAGLARREAVRGDEMGAKVLAAADQDRRRSEAEAAAHRLAEQQAEVRRLEAQLTQGDLRAPFDAVVTGRLMTDGTYAGAGETALELVDLVNREVHLEIPAAVAAGLTPGTPVSLRADELPGRSWPARLDRLVPAADPSTRTFLGIVELRDADPERRLLPGMFVRAAVVVREVTGAAVVPADAVLAGPQGAVVVRIDAPAEEAGSGGPPPPASSVFVPVRVLARDGLRTAVAPVEPGALAAGNRVVVTGVENLWPGAPVMPQPQAGPPAGR